MYLNVETLSREVLECRTSTTTKAKVKVADEVWIATALLHREQPNQADFAVEEIVDRAQKEGIERPLRPGVYVHVVQHCVANRPPNPGRYRMLFETAEGRRRLFRKGDTYHPAREGAKITPAPEDLPSGLQLFARLVSRLVRGGSAVFAGG